MLVPSAFLLTYTRTNWRRQFQYIHKSSQNQAPDDAISSSSVTTSAHDVNVRDSSCRSGTRPLFWQAVRDSQCSCMLFTRLEHIPIIQIDYGITEIVAGIILLRLQATLSIITMTMLLLWNTSVSPGRSEARSNLCRCAVLYHARSELDFANFREYTGIVAVNLCVCTSVGKRWERAFGIRSNCICPRTD